MSFFSSIKNLFVPRATSAYDAVGSRRPRSRKNALYSTGGPNAELVYDLPELRAVCRDLYYNTTDGRSAIDTVVDFVIGRGQKPQSTPHVGVIAAHLLALGVSDEESVEFITLKSDEIERRWNAWAESKMSDTLRVNNFYSQQRLAETAKMHTGEIFAVTNYEKMPDGSVNLSIGLIEADRVAEPNKVLSELNVDGLILDENGRPLKIKVRRSKDNTFSQEFDEVDFYDADGNQRVFHLFTQQRPGQMRGVPVLAAGIKKIAQLEMLAENELRAGVVNSYFAATVSSNDPNFLASLSEPERKELRARRESERDLTLENGAVLQLYDGETFNPVDPKRPNVNYGQFARDQRSELAMLFGMGVEIYMKTFGASFSASRGTLNMFKKPVGAAAEKFELDFCAPVFREWLRVETTWNGLDLPGYFSDPRLRAAWEGVQFAYEPMGQIDDVKEAIGAEKRIALKISDRTQEAAQITGNDFKNVAQNQARENILLKKLNLVDSAADKA